MERPSPRPPSLLPALLGLVALPAAQASHPAHVLRAHPQPVPEATFPGTPSLSGAALVPLADGRWLVAGGLDPQGRPVPSAFVFLPDPDPEFRRLRPEAGPPSPGEPGPLQRVPHRAWVGGDYKVAAPMLFSRAWPVAQLLRNGQVLVAGGFDHRGCPQKSAEIFDPRRGRWRQVGDLVTRRAGAAAVRLANGRVLVVGGFYRAGRPTATLETFDPDHDEFDAHPWRLPAPAAFPAVCRLDDGDVLISGGFDGHAALDSILLFDDVGGPFGQYADTPRHPLSRGSLRRAGTMVARRAGHRMRRLGEVVLIAGGKDGNPCHQERDADPPEIWDPVRVGVESLFEDVRPLDARRPVGLPGPGGDRIETGLPDCEGPLCPELAEAGPWWIWPRRARLPGDGGERPTVPPVRLEPRDRAWPFPAHTRDPRPDERRPGVEAGALAPVREVPCEAR